MDKWIFSGNDLENGQLYGCAASDFPPHLTLIISGSHELADTAAAYTRGRQSVANDTSTHDVGFVVFLSFGLGMVLDGRPYLPVVLEAAGSLAKRFNPVVGMTRSWGPISDMKQFEAIPRHNYLLLFIAFSKHH